MSLKTWGTRRVVATGPLTLFINVFLTQGKKAEMQTCARGVCVRAVPMLVVILVMTFLPGPGKSQTFRGTILGTITDQSRAAIGGAKVTVRNLDTGQTRETVTTDDGSYTVRELPIGNYSITVEKTAFRTAAVTGVRVEVSIERRADVTLQAGEVSQRIEVSAEILPQVETTADTLGGTIGFTLATDLPVNGRDYTKLIYMVPGVAGSPDQITDSPGSFGVFSVNGARGRANNFLLDGTDMNDGYRNDPAINEAGVFGTPATILPVEAVAEIRVLSNFEAEYGRSAGGVINIVTKSGSNQWHGTGLEFFRNTVLNARDYFNFKPDRKAPFHNNQFGGSLGGPILRDKTFFFVDYEGQRETGAQSSLACVPTAADIAANVPLGGINPVSAAILARKPWPAPNLPGTCLGNASEPTVSNNASLLTPFSNRVDSAIVKIDHNFNSRNLLTGRYYFGDSEQSYPLALVGGGLVPGFNTFTPTRVQLISISYVAVFSPTVVYEARVGWIRFAEGFFPQDRGLDPSTIGLNTGVSSKDFGLPKISVSGLAPIGADASTPRQRVDSNWHFIDGVSWKVGRHDLKFGYEYRRTTVSQIFDRNFRGKISFNSLGDFLAGNVGGGSQARGNTDRNTFENNHALYIQDSFRWNPRFTLNVGLRWDYFGVIQEKKNLFTNVNPTTGVPSLVGGGRLYEPDYNNFAPRISFAWDRTGKGKTVLRGGYGVFYDAFSQDFFMGHLPFAPTFDPGPAYSGIGPAPISFGSAGGTLSSGTPLYSGFSPLGDGFGVDRHIRTPYMQNFNLNLQQRLSSNAVLQVGYVGSNGRKLFRFRDINQPSQAAINAADVACVGGSNLSLGSGCVSVSRTFSSLFYILQQETAANSNYHALQTSLQLRPWHGLTSNMNYVWSHSIDTASDGEDFVPNQAQPNDSFRPNLEKGNSSFDIKHRFVWNVIYELPSGKGSWSRLTDGWGLNSVVTLQTGQPFLLNYNFEDDFDGSGNFFGRPDLVGPVRYNRSDPLNFLNLSAFAVPCTLDGTGTAAANCRSGTRHYGTLGRNSLRGNNFRNFDFSIFKRTPITEHINLEFRAEFYNILNHPNFTNPLLPLFIADAAPNGINLNGTSKGFYSLAATPDVSIGNPFLGGGGSRGIQFGLKLSF